MTATTTPIGSGVAEVLSARRSVRTFLDAPVDPAELTALAWAAQGDTGDGHRTTPSAGERWPLAVTSVVRNVGGTAPGLWRWEPDAGRSTMVAAGGFGPALAACTVDARDWLAGAAAVLVLSADLEAACAAFATEPPAWERGARYVWLEAGAAAQNVALQAAATGLGAVLVAAFDDDLVHRVHPALLPEGHDPLVMVAVGHPAI
ncbi:SagB/ThcOx family dehydrogenase [Pseudonocardia sp. CA-107938]|uniref:SagB/ThcOx family dehydrogenase n=1 Tax=Pseudonocardia sp. CA-107938 TaxID=3240021 RepID=UPI003D8B8590